MNNKDANVDGVLFNSISSGDEHAFNKLFQLYYERLYLLSLSLTKSASLCEEVLQEVFTALWVGKERLSDINNPAAYLYQITYQKISALLKKERNQLIIIDTLKNQPDNPFNTTESHVLLEETKRILQKAIHQLPEQKRIIYTLARDEGMSYQQIADYLSISVNTVRNHLVEATKMIKKNLTAAGLLSLFLYMAKHLYFFSFK